MIDPPLKPPVRLTALSPSALKRERELNERAARIRQRERLKWEARRLYCNMTGAPDVPTICGVKLWHEVEETLHMQVCIMAARAALLD